MRDAAVHERREQDTRQTSQVPRLDSEILDSEP